MIFGNYSAPPWADGQNSAKAGLRRRALDGGDKRLKDIGSLFVHGRTIGSDDAVGLAAFGCTKTARDFLLHLWHTHGVGA